MAGLDTIKQATSLGAIGDDNNQAGGGYDTGTTRGGYGIMQPGGSNAPGQLPTNTSSGPVPLPWHPGTDAPSNNVNEQPSDMYDYHAPGKEAPIDRYAHTVNPDGSFSTQPPGFASPINQAQYSSLTSATPPDKNQQKIALSAQNESPAMQAIKAGMPDYQASSVVTASNAPPAVTPIPTVKRGQVPTTPFYRDAAGRVIANGPQDHYDADGGYLGPATQAEWDAWNKQNPQAAGLPPNASPTQKIQAGLTQQAAGGASGAPATGVAPVAGGTTQLGTVPTVAQAIAMGTSFADLSKSQPDLVKQYLDALPDPGKIKSSAWYDLDQDTRDFLYGAYAAKGLSQANVDHAVEMNLPGGGESQWYAPYFNSAYRSGGHTPQITG